MKNNFLLAGKTTAKEEVPLQIVGSSTQNNLTRRIWLQYFNDYLREHEVITEDEWRKMRRRIEQS